MRGAAGVGFVNQGVRLPRDRFGDIGRPRLSRQPCTRPHWSKFRRRLEPYSTGQVTEEEDHKTFAGGLIGADGAPAGSLANTHWDRDTGGITNLSQAAGDPSNDPGITAMSSQQLQSGLPDGFGERSRAENPKINHGFPYVVSDPPPGCSVLRRSPQNPAARRERQAAGFTAATT